MTYPAPYTTPSPQPHTIHQEAIPAFCLYLTTDSQLRILQACQQTARLTGYDSPDLQGLHLAQLFAEADRPDLLKLGTLATLGLFQQARLAVGTGTGCYLKLHVVARSFGWNGVQGIRWTLQSVHDDKINSEESRFVVPEGSMR